MVKLNINVPLINNGVYTVLPNVVASDEMSSHSLMCCYFWPQDNNLKMLLCF